MEFSRASITVGHADDISEKVLNLIIQELKELNIPVTSTLIKIILNTCANQKMDDMVIS